MATKEISELEGAIRRLQEEGEKYKITNEKLFNICQAVEKAILDATPENFTICLPELNFEIKRFKGYDSGVYRDFRYCAYDCAPITEIWFNDLRVGTIYGNRAQRKEFLRNLNKILEALIAELEKNNLEAEELLSHVKVV